eukprot:scaffold1422_cov297-Prasinococcus_capsulatus_cf.AAC.10
MTVRTGALERTPFRIGPSLCSRAPSSTCSGSSICAPLRKAPPLSRISCAWSGPDQRCARLHGSVSRGSPLGMNKLVTVWLFA